MVVVSRNGRPDACQARSASDVGAQEIVAVIPIAEVAAKGHVEDAAHAGGSKVLRCRDVGRAVKGQYAPIARLSACATAVGPHVALAIHQLVEGRTVLIRVSDVTSANQGSHAAPATCRERIAHPLQIVEHERTLLGHPALQLEIVRTIEISTHELRGAQREGWHVRQIHAPYLQFEIAREIALVEFAIARDVAVLGALRTIVVHGIVRPIAIELAIVSIAGPRALMLTVTIGIHIARIRHGHVTDHIDGLHVRGIGVVVPLDDGTHAGHGR